MTEKLIQIGGQLTEIDGQNSLAIIGDHRITGLGRNCLKALAQHLYDPVVITVSKYVESEHSQWIKDRQAKGEGHQPRPHVEDRWHRPRLPCSHCGRRCSMTPQDSQTITAEEWFTLADCPPGPFMTKDGNLGFKTEYHMALPDGPTNVPGDQIRWKISEWPDAYVMSSGECFWGGEKTHADRAAVLVTPVDVVALNQGQGND